MSVSSPPLAHPTQPAPDGEDNLLRFIRWVLGLAAPVWAPIVLYKKPAMSIADDVVPLDAAGIERLPPNIRERLSTDEHALMRLGFSPPVRAVSTRSENVRSCFSLLEHPRDGALAFVLVMQGAHVGTTAVITFRSDFADGTQLYTSNSSVLLRTPTRAGIVGTRFENVRDGGELYEIHRFCVAERARRDAVVPLTRGEDPISFQLDEASELQEFWIRRGYYKRIDGPALRFTLRGAVLASWRGLFPWKQITQWRNAARANAILARRRRA